MNATLLKNITGLSLSQSTYYLAALHAPEDVRFHIQNGHIRNLDKAALIANIESIEIRKRAIEACITGASLKELRHLIGQQKMLKKDSINLKTSKQGRTTEKINMGTTLKTKVVKTIVDSVLLHQAFIPYRDIFLRVNWDDLRQVTKAFRKLIDILEVEIAG